jgi:acyl dehydratase
MTASANLIARRRDMIGVKRGPSSWRTVTQEEINLFADIARDHYWIHVDVERAKRESPFGTTIAHGNLTLSMIDGFAEEITYSDDDAEEIELGVNMGWNRVRFPAPVPAGSQIRVTGEIVSVEKKGSRWWEIVDRFTVEIEGSETPACVADSVSRVLLREPIS